MSTDSDSCLYYREGCHLCKDLAAMLYRGWPGRAELIEWRDVDSSADWQLRYGLRVPVLTVGGVVVSELLPDPEGIAEYFGPPRIPV